MAVVEGFRLSVPQRRIWRAGEPCSCARAQCVVDVAGHLDEGRLRRALDAIVERHEILRTTFPMLPGMAFPVQSVQPGGGARLIAADSADAAELLRIDREPPTDPTAQPALRATLGRSLLVLSVPVLCADARSLITLVTELGLALEGREPGEIIQYGQYSSWHRELAESDDGAAGRDFWRTHSDAGTRLDRPGGRPSGTFRAASAWTSLDRASDAPNLAALLSTAWAALVARFTGTARVVLGAIPADRPDPLLDGALGAFAVPTPLAVDLEWERPFADAVARTGAALERGRPWLPFFADETGALPIQFAVEEWPAVVPAGDATLVYRSRVWVAEPMQVRLSAVRHGTRVGVELAYDEGQFSQGAIAYLARSFTTLVERALDDRRAPLRAIDPMAPADRDRVVSAWHRSGPCEPASLGRLFEEQAARTPHAVALELGGERMTFRELDARAGEVAGALRDLQVGPDVVVGLSGERSIGTIVGLLGILKAGGAYLPLDPLDPPERVREIVAAARPRALITADGSCQPCGPAAGAAAIGAAPEPLPDHLAYVIFTSGSTGAPKGVLVRQGAVVNLLNALDEEVYGAAGPGCRVALNAPLAVDASVKQWIQLLRGRTLHIVPDEVRLDPRSLALYLRRHAIDVLDCTPTQLRPLLDEGLPGGLVVLVGGEAVDDATWQRMLASTAVRFVNVYGPTEATVDATAASVASGAPTIGRALRNVRAYLLGDRGELVPLGAPGEVYLGGHGLARGYLNAPALTADRFVPDPFSGVPGARLYRTGDRARQALDGSIEFLGRADAQVKLRGHRIELGEIERVLERHPGVTQAAVVLRDRGERPSLVAFVAADAETIRELPAHLRRRLPEVMVPSELVRVERLPVSAGGKIDRRRLASLVPAEGTPSGAPRVAARTEMERTIAAAWCRALQIEHVGVDDNFFDVGGHSLLLARVYTELRETLQRDFSMLELFRHPTVASLARFLADPQAAPSLSAIQTRAERQREALARRGPRAAPQGAR